MTDSSDHKPITRQAIAARDRSLPGKVTGRLRKALDLMLYEAASRKEAAERSGMTDHSVRQALRRPHVIAYYNAGLEVLRTSARAKNIHRLEELRDQDQNKVAAVAAIKAIEQLSDQAPSFGTSGQTPGITIVINPPAVPSNVIDVTPQSDADSETTGL